jgi:CheY-like chemotaxis protein
MAPASPIDGRHQPPCPGGASPVALLVGAAPQHARLVAPIHGAAGVETRKHGSGAAHDRLERLPAPVVVIRDLPHDRHSDPELIVRLRRAGLGAPVVYLTGDALDDHGDGQGRPVVAKPFTGERVLSEVAGALGSLDGRPWRPPPRTQVPGALLRAAGRRS